MRPLKYPKLQDKAWLQEQYVDLRKSAHQISKELGCHHSSLLDALKRLGFDIRPKWSYPGFIKDPANDRKASFNKIVRHIMAIHDVSKVVAKETLEEKEKGDNLLDSRVEKIPGAMEDTAKNTSFIKTKEFILENLDKLEPSTIKRMMGESYHSRNPGRIDAITRRHRKSKGVISDYEKELIIRMFIKGVSLQRIIDTYPQFSIHQIRRVQTEANEKMLGGISLKERAGWKSKNRFITFDDKKKKDHK